MQETLSEYHFLALGYVKLPRLWVQYFTAGHIVVCAFGVVIVLCDDIYGGIGEIVSFGKTGEIIPAYGVVVGFGTTFWCCYAEFAGVEVLVGCSFSERPVFDVIIINSARGRYDSFGINFAVRHHIPVFAGSHAY